MSYKIAVSFLVVAASMSVLPMAMAQDGATLPRAAPSKKMQKTPKASPKSYELLKKPSALTEKAPEMFTAKFETSKGDIVIEVKRASSPLGADRFYNLVKNGYFDNIRFFRVSPGFVVQFGIHGDPEIAQKWDDATINDDPVVDSNVRGTITFAKSGSPNSRTTQVFINLADNSRLDGTGFSPFGKVVKGMDVVDKLYGGYGEQITGLQDDITHKGNAYLTEYWPKLDSIKKATIVEKPATK